MTAKQKGEAEQPSVETVNGRKTVTVPLQEPIQRGADALTSVQLMKPRVGDLRGLSLSELLMCKADAVAALLPRITVPTLFKHEVDAMDPADFVMISGEVVDFLTPQAARGLQSE